MKLYALDRKTPLKHFDDFSVLSTLAPLEESLTVHAAKGECFVLQLLLVSGEEHEEVRVKTAPLTYGDATVPDAVTCINTQGVNKWGEAFEKKLELTSRQIQPVYVTVSLEDCASPTARTQLRFEGNTSRSLSLTILMDGGEAVNHGFNELWRLSRLKWLNSTLEETDAPASGYPPVQWQEGCLHFLGRTVHLGENGLPGQVESRFDEAVALQPEPQARLLREPMAFDVGEPIRFAPLTYQPQGANGLLSANGESDHLLVHLSAQVRYEGALAYQIRLTAKEDCILKDVRLRACYTPESSQYNNGLGKPGGNYQDLTYTWNELHQDCLYTGNVPCGMRIKWKAEQYVRPLVNIYYEAQKRKVPDETWANHGKGRIVSEFHEGAVVTACTGAFSMAKGERRVFSFELHFTPFKEIDCKKHFATRYCHNHHLTNWRKELALAKKNHLTHIVVHHGNCLHPFINYPFYENEEMKAFVAAAHQEGIGVKLYYTSREHSNHMAEVFAYKALGDEIILRKPGKGYPWKGGVSPWLTEYFGDSIIPAWRVLYKKGNYKGDHDISFIVRPDSRLDNYYVEGLRWLTEQIGIDGIYIDDTALDRQTMERARKVLDKTHGLIDMHMWNHETKDAGFASCANLYTEIFPFLDSLWIGEGFPARRLSPDYLLTEVSGIPYGQTSQMLDEPDGHIGMLYGMNSRFGWGTKQAVHLYRLWDSFGIGEASMRGYWHSRCPVSTGDKDVLVTAYLRENCALLAVYNFSKQKKQVRLHVDPALLGFEPRPVAVAPRVAQLQPKKKVALDAPLSLRGRHGLLLLLNRT